MQLLSERLTLRPRTRADLPQCMAMDRDPEVTKYIAGPWQCPIEHRTFLEDRMAHVYLPPFGYWTITPTHAAENFLGWVMLLPEDTHNKNAEIGWRLTRAAWGRGFATEAVITLIDAAYAKYPTLNIIATIHPENAGSIHVAEKIGMSFDKAALVEGHLENFYQMSFQSRCK